jgi:hypothetical protein
MKLKLFVLAASLTSLIACGSNPVSKPNPDLDPKPEPGASSEVSGQVNGWPQGRSGMLRAVVSRKDSGSNFVFAILAQGSIDQKGKFGFKLTNAPDSSFLKPYEVCGIKTTANALELELFDVAEAGFETDGSKFVALLAQVNTSAQAIRVYLDRNLEVNGPCTDGGISAKLSLKKGWNLVLRTFTEPGNAGAVYSSASGIGIPFEFKLTKPGWLN